MSEAAPPGRNSNTLSAERRGPSRPVRSALGAFWSLHRADLLGVAFLVVFAFCYLSPAIKDGANFGPADLGSGLSALTSSGQANHNVVNGDIIDQGVPWNTLDWRLVHHGQLPLWNGYSGTGMPHFLNFESAVFALPTLVGYLFPLSLSFLVIAGMKLVIAGIGTYLFCRLIGAGALGASLAGSTFMLSGAFSGWLGWAVSGPISWAGFLAAGVVLSYHSRRRIGGIACLSLSVAFAIYAGFAEGYVLLALGFGVLLAVTGVVTLAHRRSIDLSGVARIGLGLVIGLGLSAPLWLPGIPILRGSARAGKDAAVGLPLRSAVLTFAQGYDGLPIRGSSWFGPVNFFETSAYVGMIALVLVGIVLVCSWRRPVVAGLGIATGCSFLVAYQLGSGAPIQHLIRDVGLGAVSVQRMLSFLAFCIAVLAGLGLDLLRRRFRERFVARTFLVMSGAALFVILLLWGKSTSAAFLPGQSAPGLNAVALRQASLIWPSAGTILVVLVALLAYARIGGTDRPRSRLLAGGAGGLLLTVQSASLLFAGVGINSYSTDAYPETPAVRQLQSIVGTNLLGLDGGNTTCIGARTVYCGIRDWMEVGFYPEMNIAYEVRELALHDPTIPAGYFSSWPVPNAGQDFAGNLNLFVPAVTSVALARAYGVAYVLVGPKLPSPVGMRRVATIDGEGLYAVPDGAQFSFVAPKSQARVTGIHQRDNASWDIPVVVHRRASLVLRVTDVPGWHVSADGKALSIDHKSAASLSVTVPPGTHSVTLRYWPAGLTAGFALALLSLAFLVALEGTDLVRQRRRRNTGVTHQPERT